MKNIYELISKDGTKIYKRVSGITGNCYIKYNDNNIFIFIEEYNSLCGAILTAELERNTQTKIIYGR